MVSKKELLDTLKRYWLLIDSLCVTVQDVDSNIVQVGIVVSSSEPTEKNVMWLQTLD